MKVTLKKSKVSTALLKQLEAAGIVVTLIISSAAGATELQRGDLNAALKASETELRAIAAADPDAFDMQNLEDQGAVEYMCNPDNGSYSTELDKVCAGITLAQRK